jgi:CHASE2 domain-containing sensor protein
VKTQIIQKEPEAQPTVAASGELPGSAQRETWLLRGAVATAVIGYVILGVLHPFEIKVGDDTTLYLALHIVQPFLILLLAFSIWLLVKDLPGRAAQVARVAILPYAIAYSMLDAIAGIALGQVIREANGMSPTDAAVIQRALDGSDPDVIGIVIFVASGLTWLVAAVATAIAVKQVGGRGPTTLIALGAAVFAVGHPWPPGPIGIALFGLGVAWLEYRRELAPVPEAAPEAQPVLVP